MSTPSHHTPVHKPHQGGDVGPTPIHPVAHTPPEPEQPKPTKPRPIRPEPTGTETEPTSLEPKLPRPTTPHPGSGSPPDHTSPVEAATTPLPQTRRSGTGGIMMAAFKGVTLKKQPSKVAALLDKAVEQQVTSAAARPLTDRDQEVLAPKFVANCVLDAAAGKLDSSRAALKDLQDRTSAIDTAARTTRLRDFLDGIFADKTVLAGAAKNADFFAELVVAADGGVFRSEALPAFAASKLASLGDAAPAVAAQTLLKVWNQPTWATPDLLQWTCRTIPKADWNDRPRGLAARAYNALWEAGRFDLICDLIKAGVDSMQSCSDSMDMGRRREGIWSGYVQPLEHLLGNYLKLVAAGPSAIPPVPTIADGEDDSVTRAAVVDAELKAKEVAKTNSKIAGAKLIFDTLDSANSAGILTSFAKVEQCQLVGQFAKVPGTIWGFEDVRLPYVQASRETPNGAQPIRMWDIWTAIDPALSQIGYTALLTDPDTTIPQCVKTGVDKIKEGIKAKNPQYAFAVSTPDPDGARFLAAFEQQATTYLRFFSQQVPLAKFATAQRAGSNISKLMGAIGCKVGLWWAKDQGKPVYYCLDGIDMSQVVSYKSFKNKAINTILQKPGSNQYCEVITFAELREIIRNWRDFAGVVTFVDRGKLVSPDDKRIQDWRQQVLLDSTELPSRLAPDKALFATELNALDPKLLTALNNVQAKRVVAQSETLKLVLQAKAALLGPFLLECDALYDAGLLPQGLGDLYNVAENAPGAAERGQLVARLRAALVSVGDPLGPALVNAVNRRFPDNPPGDAPLPGDRQPDLSTLLDSNVDV
jgi:hypothetical protein